MRHVFNFVHFLAEFDPENFANIWQNKWNEIRSVKFETVRIHFSGLARVLGYTVYRGFLNRVYGILQLKYGYSVYHFLWISGIKYTWV